MSSPNNTDSSVGKGKTGSTPKKSSSDRDPGRKKTNRNVVTPHNFDTKHYNNPAVKLVGTRSATDLTTWPDVVPTAERTLENVDDVDVQE